MITWEIGRVIMWATDVAVKRDEAAIENFSVVKLEFPDCGIMCYLAQI